MCRRHKKYVVYFYIYIYVCIFFIGAYATYQEFANDGFLWITNLTVADPFVLPIAMGLFNLAIIEVSFKRFLIGLISCV